MDSIARGGAGVGENEAVSAERLVFFEAAYAFADSVVRAAAGAEAAGWTADQLEDRIDADGQEFKRLVLQGHLDLRAAGEQRVEQVADAGGVPRRQVEPGTARTLATVFGKVGVARMAYRRYGHANLYPADGWLNLPGDSYSFGLRKLAAIEACRGSFADAVDAIERRTGTAGVPKRQVGELAVRAAADFETFYATGERPAAEASDVLVLTTDGKGIVVTEDALREGSGNARRCSDKPVAKTGRKRMAQIGSVYDAAPVVRTPDDIIAPPAGQAAAREPVEPPARWAGNKWVTASITDSAAEVIAEVFDEAQRRDPGHARTWVALVDGANHQIAQIKAQAKARGVPVTIVVDFIHVIEYLWKAAWCFFSPDTPDGRQAATGWVHTQATKILNGHAGQVAGAIRRKATKRNLSLNRRVDLDDAATYLLNKKPYLDYPTALAGGWPIATGIIEGACRHLVKDRFDITGARWGLPVAEALLRLRAIITNGDLTAYWTHHLAAEHHRTHRTRYHGGAIPQAP